MKSVICIVMILSLLVCLPGCVSTSGEAFPTSDSLPDFTSVPEEPEGGYEPQYHISNDGSIRFAIDASLSFAAESLPTVEVTPHYLTAEDVKRVAEALFPDGDFYEGNMIQSDRALSKSEIQAKLERWEPYADPAAWSALIGREQDNSVVVRFLEEYRQKMETAPEEITRESCRWQWRNEMDYYTEEDVGTGDSEGNDMIVAQLNYHGIPYTFFAAIRNSESFRVNMLSCFIDSGISPLGIDEYIFAERLCGEEAPTPQQLEAAKERAEALLVAFGLGQWQVAQCCTSEDGNSISVNAVPVLCGVAAYWSGTGGALRNAQAEFTGHYNTVAEFAFSPNGELLGFTLTTPLEIRQIVEPTSPALELSALQECMIKELSSRTASEYYGIWSEVMAMSGAQMDCELTVTELEYTLYRQTVSISEDLYRYVPALVSKGTVEFTNRADGKTVEREESKQLLVQNIFDGTIIQ